MTSSSLSPLTPPPSGDAAASLPWTVSVQIRKTLRSPDRVFELDVAFDWQGTRLVLFGPSGAGKTMTLAAIAGLLRPDAGRITINGQTVFDTERNIWIAPRHRHLAYLFQDYALFPHLTVRQNIAFGLHRGPLNPSRRARDPLVDEWLEALELRSVAQQFPAQLSGGQKQRTALARALATQPRLILLDEPFAALDVALRARMRTQLLALQARVATPMLLITHDPDDLASFGDRVVELRDGRVIGA
ncbi:MAG: sulfate/molybdate ABC transporter ATP-binding protein [Janthinobacterium lividum]